MSNKKNINETVIKNIKFLMARAHEKSCDLADELDSDESTINKYLKGTRSISDDVLTKIAIHFRLNNKEALFESNLPELINNVDKCIEPIDILHYFILPYSKKETKNAELRNVCELIESFFDSIENGKVNCELFDQIEAFFTNISEKAKENDEIILCVWYCMFEEYINSFYIDDNEDEIDDKDMLVHHLFNGIKHTFDYEKENEQFYKYCKLLKNSKWADLVYYYIALRYFLGYGNKDYDIEMNQKIGISLLQELLLMENKYAIDLFDFFAVFQQ